MSRTLVDVEEAGPASFEELRVRDCSIKRTLDVVGEKWTLLVLREAFYGARRFEQFLANVGCARTLLSERLATLVEHGVLQREPYREAGQRERHQYLLTDKGHDLFAALVVLMQWGDRWEAGPEGGPWWSGTASAASRCTWSCGARTSIACSRSRKPNPGPSPG